jgi:hypothetical protein
VINAGTVALLASSALHAGFQLTVTFVVYPGLADVHPDRRPVAAVLALAGAVLLAIG